MAQGETLRAVALAVGLLLVGSLVPASTASAEEADRWPNATICLQAGFQGTDGGVGVQCNEGNLAKAQVKTKYAEVSVCATVEEGEIEILVSGGECDSSLLFKEAPSSSPDRDPEDLTPCLRLDIDEPSVHVDLACIE